MIKSFFILTILVAMMSFASAEAPKSIQLNSPNLERGLPVMTALSKRASATEFNTRKLELQDLSDLIWAAFGINRPESGKRTAPSSFNAHDIDLYVFFEEGVYIYQAEKNVLHIVEPGDHRKLVAGAQPIVSNAPLFILIVSDYSKFPIGTEEIKKEWSAISAGLVSQNISIFCAATDLITRPRATMEKEALSDLLFLPDNQMLLLNHPVSYSSKED